MASPGSDAAEGRAGGLEFDVLASARDPKISVIWLHGVGQDSDALVPMAQRLRLPRAGVRSVFPRAPQQLSSPLTGQRARAWFPLNLLTLNGAELPGVLAMERRLRALLAAEAAIVGGPRRVLLAGFSQGATMALWLGMRYPRRLGGSLLYAPFLGLDEKLFNPIRPWKAREPVWIGHGGRDLVVPRKMSAAVRDMLRRHGYRVYWNAYPGGHEPFVEALEDQRLATFVDTLLDRLDRRRG